MFNPLSAIPVRENQEGFSEVPGQFDFTSALISDEKPPSADPLDKLPGQEISAAEPRYQPPMSDEQRAKAVVEKSYKDAGQKIPIGLQGQWFLENPKLQLAEKNLMACLVPGGWAFPAYNVFKGLLDPQVPANASFSKMLFDATYRGLAENQKVEVPGGSIASQYPNVDWRISGAIGALSEMIFFTPTIVEAGIKGTGAFAKTFSKDGQLAMFLDDLPNNPRYGDLLNHIKGNLDPKIPGGADTAHIHQELRNFIWDHRKDLNFWKLFNANLKRVTGIDIMSEAGQVAVTRTPTVGQTVQYAAKNGKIMNGLIKRVEGERLIVQIGKKDVVLTAAQLIQQTGDKAPMLYSKLMATLAEKMPEKATPDQVRNIIKQSVSQEEQELFGIEAYLQGKDKINKSDLLAQLNEQPVVIEEIIKQGTSVAKRSKEIEDFFGNHDLTIRRGMDGEITVEDFNGDELTPDDLEALTPQAREMADEYQQLRGEFEAEKPEAMPKFDQYQIPGGQNYQEMLLTVPKVHAPAYQEINSWEKVKKTKYGWIWENSKTKDVVEMPGEEHPKDATRLPADKNFMSSHWDEPNVFAHVRMNDRVTADGKKVLFVEELQSDWARSARENKTVQEIRETLERQAKNEHMPREAKEQLLKDSRLSDKELLAKFNKTPSHPMVKKWLEVSVKRVLHYAAENGYDYVAWVNGQQTADRYDLSKQIKSVNVKEKTDKRVTFSIVDKNGNDVSLPSGIAVPMASTNEYSVDISKLPDVVGKDLAKKIIEGKEFVTYKAKDLNVGGEWAHNLYNVQVPKLVEDLTRKWGGETEAVRIDAPIVPKNTAGMGPEEAQAELIRTRDGAEELIQEGIRITPQMRQGILQGGFPLFGKEAPEIGKPGLERDMQIFRMKEATEVINTRGEPVTLPAKEEYRVLPVVDKDGNVVPNKVRLQDGKQITVYEGELAKLKGHLLQPGEQPMAGGKMHFREKIGTFVNQYAQQIAQAPKRVFDHFQEVFMEEFGINDANKTALIKTPIEDVTVTQKHLEKLLKHSDVSRKTFIRYIRPTLEQPLEITDENGKHNYIKLFQEEDGTRMHAVIVSLKPDGNFYVTNIPISEAGKMEARIQKGDRVYAAAQQPPEASLRTGNESIPQEQADVKEIQAGGQQPPKDPPETAVEGSPEDEPLQPEDEATIRAEFEQELAAEATAVKNALKTYLSGKFKPELKEQGEYADLKHLSWLFAKPGARGYTPDELAEELQGMGFAIGNSDQEVLDLIKSYFIEDIEKNASSAFARSEKSYQNQQRKDIAQVTARAAKELARATKRTLIEATQIVDRIERQLAKKVASGKIKALVRQVTGQMGQEPTITEEEALRIMFKKQAQAAKAGFRAGKEAGLEQAKARIDKRQEIIDQLRAKQEDIRGVQDKIVEYAKENLDLDQRGKLISAVKNAKNQRDLTEAFSRIEEYAEQAERKQIVQEIRKSAGKLTESPSIAIDYAQRIQKLIDRISFTTPKEETVAALQETLDFMRRKKAAGEDVEMPEWVFEKLSILRKKPVSEMSRKELLDLKSNIELLGTLGKTKQGARKAVYEAEKAKIAQLLTTGTVSLDKYDIKTPGIGQELNAKDKLGNAINKTLSELQRVDLALTPMDVVFDLLDGGHGKYSGTNYTLIKAKTDANFGRYLDAKDQLQDPLKELAEQLNLNRYNFERIGVYAAKVQEGGVQKLMDSGYSIEEIDSIDLTEAEMKWYNKAREVLDSQREPLKKFMREVYNQEMGEVENYFSFMSDFNAMDEAEIFQRFGDMAEEFGVPTKNAEMGFTKERTLGRQKIKIDAYDVFMKHVDNVAYLLNMGRDNKMLFEIANSPEYKEAAGARGQRIVLEFLDLVARKGGVGGQRAIPILDTLRKNIGVGVLGFKVTSTLVQPTSLIDAAAYIGNWAFRGAHLITQKEWHDLVLKFPEVRERIGDDPAFLTEGALKKFQEAGMTPIKALDKWAAMSTAAGAYAKFMEEAKMLVDFDNPNPMAMQYAQFVMRRTQSSGFFKDAPMAISRGGITGNRSLDKAVLQFQAFVINKWSIIRHDVIHAGIHEKDPAAISKAVWLFLATLAGVGVRAGYTKVKDAMFDQDTKVDIPKNMMSEMIQNVPILGPAISQAMAKGQANFPIPMITAIGDILKSGQRMYQGKRSETKIRGLAGLLQGIATLYGIPGSTEIGSLMQRGLRKKTNRMRPLLYR